MLSFNRRTRVFVCKQSTDMRASYDTLFTKAKTILNKDPWSGHLFVFINSRRTSIKCLYYDGTGLVIIAKRMKKGLFSLLNPHYRKPLEMTAAEFGLFFEGADFKKRFIESPHAIRKSIKKPKNISLPMSQELQVLN